MKLYSGLAAQPEYPAVDLTPKNAESLEIFLANQMMVTDLHGLAEQTELAFRVGHPAAVGSSTELVDSDGAKVAAIEHGVMVFEAINAAVASTGVSKDELAIQQAALTIWGARKGDKILRAIDSRDIFKNEMPLTTEVIHSASSRFFGAITDYAILGAALQRQIALDEATMDYGKN